MLCNLDIMFEKVKIHQFLALIFLSSALCYQLPAWGRAGLAETPFYTPEGDMFGMDGQEGKREWVMGGNNFSEYGYYDDELGGKFIVGEDKNGSFKLFDRVKEKTLEFPNRTKLCNAVKSKRLKFNSNVSNLNFRKIKLDLDLPIINQLNRLDYYIIQFSIYIGMPFIGLLVIYNIFTNRDLPLLKRIDKILNSNSFSLPVTIIAIIYNLSLVNGYYSESFVFLGFFGLIFMSYPAWVLARKSLMLFDNSDFRADWLVKKFSDSQLACLKSFVFLGVLMIVLSFSLGSCQAPLTSGQYFYCG
jgi:hypothetical protein